MKISAEYWREYEVLAYVAQPSIEYLLMEYRLTLRNWQQLAPSNVKTLRSFLGLASYYRRFVPNFAKVARPLHSLTKKDSPFVWIPDCQLAFMELKQLLTSAPVLSYPDFQKPFVLETDASGSGLGAVLAQRQEDHTVRPIAYASRSLQAHERNYGITELEGLGVVWALKHFRSYLYGHSCDIFTDHQALKSLLNTPQPSGKLARWGMAIQELGYFIVQGGRMLMLIHYPVVLYHNRVQTLQTAQLE